jgi:hypothetical protein
VAVETDVGVWDKIIGLGVAGVGGLVGFVFKHTNDRIDRLEATMMSKEDFEVATQNANEIRAAIKSELAEGRVSFAKIFDQMREMDQRSYQQHIDLLTAVTKVDRRRKDDE